MNKLSIMPVLAISLICAPFLLGEDCIQCHTKKGVKEFTPATAPILIKANGKTHSITLSDAFKFHGHPCPGGTIAYRALQYGIRLLFGNETPDREDLVVFSKTPTSGSLDVIDLVMIGEKRKNKTAAPEGMKPSRDTFGFILYRKSTATAVDVHLNTDLFPKDFFEIKGKQASGKSTPDEWNTLHGYMKNMITTFPNKPFEELFGRPKPYKTIVWGNLMPAHATSNSMNMK